MKKNAYLYNSMISRETERGTKILAFSGVRISKKSEVEIKGEIVEEIFENHNGYSIQTIEVEKLDIVKILQDLNED